MDFQSQPTDNSVVKALWCKADIAISPDPYTLSMAQCSGRGACGFVLVSYSAISSRKRGANDAVQIEFSDWPDWYG
jgi:hypothetical protein